MSHWSHISAKETFFAPDMLLAQIASFSCGATVAVLLTQLLSLLEKNSLSTLKPEAQGLVNRWSHNSAKEFSLFAPDILLAHMMIFSCEVKVTVLLTQLLSLLKKNLASALKPEVQGPRPLSFDNV